MDRSPDTMGKLAESNGKAAPCLAFTLLTAVRPGEARGMRWTEVDLGDATWLIPPERMKAGRAHRVPLSAAALAILADMQVARRDGAELVFEGGKKDQPLSDVAVSKTLRAAAGRRDVTVHGCRSSFRDWCDEVASVPSEVAEAALAHVNPDKTERAYARSDLFERRRELMAAWTDHCTKVSGQHGSVPQI